MTAMPKVDSLGHCGLPPSNPHLFFSPARSTAGPVEGQHGGWLGRAQPGLLSAWTEDTALAVLLKDLKAAHGKGPGHGMAMPFNALSSTLLFQSRGQTPKTRRT